MSDPETGNCILLNGEIYNHLEVRRALGGAPWRSRSDTETVLRSYATWGPACLERLHGMFAVAIWDRSDRSLWCARDRFGIKPFYYSAAAGPFVFASEVRALLASGLVPRRIARRGLAGYVRFGSVPDPLTLLDGSPPGTGCACAREASRTSGPIGVRTVSSALPQRLPQRTLRTRCGSASSAPWASTCFPTSPWPPS